MERHAHNYSQSDFVYRTSDTPGISPDMVWLCVAMIYSTTHVFDVDGGCEENSFYIYGLCVTKLIYSSRACFEGSFFSMPVAWFTHFQAPRLSQEFVQ